MLIAFIALRSFMNEVRIVAAELRDIRNKVKELNGPEILHEIKEIKKKLKKLIEEHLVLRKRMENLREELKKLEGRYDEVGQLLYWCRSTEFLRSVLWYLQDLKEEYGKDPYFDDLVYSVIHSLKDHEPIEQRKNYTPRHLLHLFDEKLE